MNETDFTVQFRRRMTALGVRAPFTTESAEVLDAEGAVVALAFPDDLFHPLDPAFAACIACAPNRACGEPAMIPVADKDA